MSMSMRLEFYERRSSDNFFQELIWTIIDLCIQMEITHHYRYVLCVKGVGIGLTLLTLVFALIIDILYSFSSHWSA